MFSRTANFLVVVLAAGVWVAHGSIIEYFCITDSTIYVVNPNASYFMSATATNMNGLVCNVTMTPDKINITIGGCPKDIYIMFTLSTRSSEGSVGDGIVGGNAVTENYLIQCREVPPEGVRFTRGLYLEVEAETVVDGVTQPAPNTEQPVTPKFTLQTGIWDIAYTEEKTNGVVGQELRWKISGPVEYDIMPQSCTAYSGTTVGGSPSQLLVTNGCSGDYSLLGDFQVIGSEQNVFAAVFYVFRFYNSDDLTLACTVLTCPKGEPACNLPSCGRKRRLANRKKNVLVDPKDTFQKYLVVEHLHVSMFAKASMMGPTITVVVLCVWSAFSLSPNTFWM